MALVLAVLWPSSYNSIYGVRFESETVSAIVCTRVGDVFVSVYKQQVMDAGLSLINAPTKGEDFLQGFAIERTQVVGGWSVYVNLPSWFAIAGCLVIGLAPWAYRKVNPKSEQEKNSPAIQ